MYLMLFRLKTVPIQNIPEFERNFLGMIEIAKRG